MSNYDEHGNWTAPPPPRDCKHGYLARSCRLCEQDRLIEHQDERIKQLGMQLSLANEIIAEKFELAAQVATLREAMLNTANACRIWGGEAERARKILEHYLALPEIK